MKSLPASPRRGFTLVELLVVIAIIGVLVALLLPAVQAARESARRTQCINHLKQFALATHNYHDTYLALPTGGDNGPGAANCCNAADASIERYNWTFHVLPFMEQTPVYQLWPNKIGQLNKTIVGLTYCPSRRSKKLYQGFAKCDYAGSRGTANNGVFVQTTTGWIGLRNVTDGTSNTLMFGEKRVHRAFMDNSSGCCGDNEGAWNSGWADDVIRAATFTPAADVFDGSLAAGIVDNQFGAAHPAGMNSAYADGSVKLVSYNVDLTVFRNDCIRDDGNP